MRPGSRRRRLPRDRWIRPRRAHPQPAVAPAVAAVAAVPSHRTAPATRSRTTRATIPAAASPSGSAAPVRRARRALAGAPRPSVARDRAQHGSGRGIGGDVPVELARALHVRLAAAGQLRPDDGADPGHAAQHATEVAQPADAPVVLGVGLGQHQRLAELAPEDRHARREAGDLVARAPHAAEVDHRRAYVVDPARPRPVEAQVRQPRPLALVLVGGDRPDEANVVGADRVEQAHHPAPGGRGVVVPAPPRGPGVRGWGPPAAAAPARRPPPPARAPTAPPTPPRSPSAAPRLRAGTPRGPRHVRRPRSGRPCPAGPRLAAT